MSRVERILQGSGECANATGVSADIVRIRRRRPGHPRRVGGRRRVAVGVGQLDGSDGSPEAVRAYFEYQTEISASAKLMSTAANMRAASTMSNFRTPTWSRSAVLNCTKARPE